MHLYPFKWTKWNSVTSAGLCLPFSSTLFFVCSHTNLNMKTSCKIACEIKTSTSKTCMLFKIACKGAQSCHILSGFLKSVRTFWVDITHNIHRLLFSLSLCLSHTSWFSWLHCCCMSLSCSSRERFCSSSLSSFSCTSCRSACRQLSSSEPFWTSSCRSWERKREFVLRGLSTHLYQSNNKQDFINTDNSAESSCSS